MLTRSGTVVPINLNGRAGTQTLLTNSGGAYQSVIPQSGVSPEAFSLQGTNPAPVNFLWYILGLFILIVLLKIAVEHEKSGMDVAFVHVGVYNWISITLMALLGFLFLKVVVNKYYVKGVTELVNAA